MFELTNVHGEFQPLHRTLTCSATSSNSLSAGAAISICEHVESLLAMVRFRDQDVAGGQTFACLTGLGVSSNTVTSSLLFVLKDITSSVLFAGNEIIAKWPFQSHRVM
jgi:hypothetical protein